VIFLGNLICEGIFALAGLGKHLSDSYVSLYGKNTSLLIILIILSVAFALLFKTKKRIIKLIPAFVLYMGICLYLLIASAGEGVYYYTNNQNDAFLVDYQGNCTLIDVSNGKKTFTKNAKSALISSPLGSTNIDTYVITHSHLDHLVSVDFLASEGYLSRVYMPKPSGEDEITVFRELDQLSRTYSFDLITYTPSNDPVDISGMDYTFQNPMDCSYDGFHKVLLFEMEISSKRIIYAGQNLGDTDFDDYMIFAEADAAVIGSHHPTLKKDFTYRLFEKNALLIVSTSEIAPRVLANIKPIIPENGSAICLFNLP
jgi:hypothetical protein